MAVMSNDLENPYGTNEVDETPDGTSVYLYSELPKICPRCENKFSQTFYRRLYRRKFRLHTKLFLAFVIIAGLILSQFNGLIAIVPAVLLGSWAMTWHKKVRVYCGPCGWSNSYIVYVRGYRK